MVLLAAFTMYATNPAKPDPIKFIQQVIVIDDGSTPPAAEAGLPGGITIVQVNTTPTPTPTPYVEPVFVSVPEDQVVTPTPAPSSTPVPEQITVNTNIGQVEHVTPLTDQERYNLPGLDIPVIRTGKGTIVPDNTTFGEVGYHRGDTARLRVTVYNAGNAAIDKETIAIGLYASVLDNWVKFPVNYNFSMNILLEPRCQTTQDIYVPIPEQLVPGKYKVDIDIYDHDDGSFICGVTKEVNIL